MRCLAMRILLISGAKVPIIPRGFVNATNGNYVSVFAGELQFSVDSDVIFHAVQRGVLVSSALI